MLPSIWNAFIWNASEGANPELKQFPNMLYMVGIVMLVSAIIIRSNAGKGMFQKQKCVIVMFNFYLEKELKGLLQNRVA
jgi:hypothetical protein